MSVEQTGTSNTFDLPQEYREECVKAAQARGKQVYAWLADGKPQSTVHLSMVPYGTPYMAIYPSGRTIRLGGL